MTEDSDLSAIEFHSAEPPAVKVPAPEKRPAKAWWLVGAASLVLLLIVASLLSIPGLRNDFLPGLAAGAGLVRAASSPAVPESLPAVPVLWKGLDLGALPAGAAQNLRQGKYYYDQRLPGNFGLAIDYWKKALAVLGDSNRSGVQSLVASAERELASQFSADSGDAFVLLKQGKRDQAVVLLERMRSDYLDINAPQYTWASQMLYRRRR